MRKNLLYILEIKRIARLLFWLCFIPLALSCEKNEVPEYTRHDWYTHYNVDNTVNTIVKDGYDNSFLPSLVAYESYGSELLPDGTESIMFVTLEAGFTAKDEISGNTFGFNIVFVLTDEQVLSSSANGIEERLERLITFFDNRILVNIPDNRDIDNYVNISLSDKNEHSYTNLEFNNGTYGVLLDYVVKVKNVNKILGPNEEYVLGIELDIEADLKDQNRGGEYNLLAKSRIYLLPPFGN